jgi:hypothetical protein
MLNPLIFFRFQVFWNFLNDPQAPGCVGVIFGKFSKTSTFLVFV